MSLFGEGAAAAVCCAREFSGEDQPTPGFGLRPLNEVKRAPLEALLFFYLDGTMMWPPSNPTKLSLSQFGNEGGSSGQQAAGKEWRLEFEGMRKGQPFSLKYICTRGRKDERGLRNAKTMQPDLLEGSNAGPVVEGQAAVAAAVAAAAAGASRFRPPKPTKMAPRCDRAISSHLLE